MLDLKFWSMFLGFLLLVASVPALLAPKSLKKIFKQIFKDANHIRSIAIWYLSVGPLIAYSSWMSAFVSASYLLFIIGLLFTIQGILLFFFTKLYQRKFLKPVLKQSELVYLSVGAIGFLVGLVFLYSGLLFL